MRALLIGSLLTILVVVHGQRSYEEPTPEKSNKGIYAYQPQAQKRKPSYQEIDSIPSESGYGHGHHGGYNGRVQMKVYRGQSKQHGYDYFAPYGYWVRQPPDNHGHGHGY